MMLKRKPGDREGHCRWDKHYRDIYDPSTNKIHNRYTELEVNRGMIIKLVHEKKLGKEEKELIRASASRYGVNTHPSRLELPKGVFKIDFEPNALAQLENSYQNESRKRMSNDNYSEIEIDRNWKIPLLHDRSLTQNQRDQLGRMVSSIDNRIKFTIRILSKDVDNLNQNERRSIENNFRIPEGQVTQRDINDIKKKMEHMQGVLRSPSFEIELAHRVVRDGQYVDAASKENLHVGKSRVSGIALERRFALDNEVGKALIINSLALKSDPNRAKTYATFTADLNRSSAMSSSRPSNSASRDRDDSMSEMSPNLKSAWEQLREVKKAVNSYRNGNNNYSNANLEAIGGAIVEDLLPNERRQLKTLMRQYDRENDRSREQRGRG